MKTSHKNVLENLIVFLTGRYDCCKTDLNDLSNAALYSLVKHDTFGRGASHTLPKLTQSQKSELKSFWSPYFYHIPTRQFRFYLAQTGRFDPAYIPEDIMVMHVDRYLSDREQAKIDDNKCLYRKWFPNTAQPITYASCMSGQWVNSDYEPISIDDVLSNIPSDSEVVIKAATHSEQGSGVEFIHSFDITYDYLKSISQKTNDTIIQSVVTQHEFLSKLQPKSVNCLRIYSLFWSGTAHICLAVLKVGGGILRVDNVHSNGYVVALDENGCIRDYVVNCHSEHESKIPDNIAPFIGQQIPGYKEALGMVLEAHSHVPRYGFISWDIAIDANACPVLIEPNFSISGVREHQFCSGPMFGELTKDILDQVFRKKGLSPLLRPEAKYKDFI